MSCQQVKAYYSTGADVYHNCNNCTLGDNIEPDKRESGKPGNRRLCKRCKSIQTGKVTR